MAQIRVMQSNKSDNKATALIELVEVTNTKTFWPEVKPDYVWTGYEVRKNGVVAAFGDLQGLYAEYDRQVAFAEPAQQPVHIKQMQKDIAVMLGLRKK